MESNVVITGMGVFTSIGRNVETFRDGLKNGDCGIKNHTVPCGLPETLGIAAKVDFTFNEEVKQWNSILGEISSSAKKNLRRASRVTQLAALTAMEGWVNANLHEMPVQGDKIGLVVAGSNLNQYMAFSQYTKYMEAPEYVSPSYALQFMDTDLVGNLSELFGIRGEGFTVGGASASGNVAVIKAYQLLMCSDLDVCMVVAPITELSNVELMAFNNLGVLGGKAFGKNAQEACRPFDEKHAGFVPGEGCGCLILEKRESAQNRGARVYAELLSGVMQLDGNRLSNPSLTGESETMKKAIDMAGLNSEDIQYINAHATSTPMGDEIEVEAIKNVFKDKIRDIWINSTKSLIGHCLYSAGLIELIASIVEMNENFLHPNLNLSNAIDLDLKLVGGVTEKADITYAMSNSFGFGGINTCIIVKRGI